MKIVTWNCNGALRRKLLAVDELNADVLVVQECEDLARSTEDYRRWAGGYLWIGESPNRGIGIFPKNGHSVRALDWHGVFRLAGLESQSEAIQWASPDLRLFLPFSIDDQLTGLAVWTKGGRGEPFGYMGQFWKYLQIHRDKLAADKTVILGDFNSNTCWDQPGRWWNHSDVVAELASLSLRSLYHHQFSESQGREKTPTFFMHRRMDRPFHIDYVFVSNDLLEQSVLEVGAHEAWVGWSDHVPLSVHLPA